MNGEPIEKATSKCDDLEGHNKTTQKIVGILADFLDGEVCRAFQKMYIHMPYVLICVESLAMQCGCRGTS